jgi:hypothetical protein
MVNMTQNNDVTNTNGAPKEYWEARAQKEREQAKAIASARRTRTIIYLIGGGLFLFVMILPISLCMSGCASTGVYGTSTEGSSSTGPAMGRILSEGVKTDPVIGYTYLEVTFYLPETGNVTYEVYQTGRDTESIAQGYRESVNNGSVASWIKVVTKGEERWEKWYDTARHSS